MLIATLENPPNLFNIINLEKAEKRFNFAWRLGNLNPRQIKNVTGNSNKVVLWHQYAGYLRANSVGNNSENYSSEKTALYNEKE